MRRRVRLSRLAVWTVIAAGPIALGLAITSTPATVEAATADKPTAAVRTTAVAADPAGYAQLFVAAWLRSSADDTTSTQARLAQAMGPDVELPDPAEEADTQSAPESVTAVRSAQRGQGAWSVTVAAQYPDGQLRYYALSVTADRTGGSFTVTGAPGVVAGPGRAEVPQSVYGVSVPEGELFSALEGFFAAYLTGAGEVTRYLAPGVSLATVSPAPYETVTVTQVSAVEESAAGEQMPADGTEVRLLAQVQARDTGGRWPLAYELSVTSRSGRWEIAALRNGTAQGGGERS